jgi:hypothetical protein
MNSAKGFCPPYVDRFTPSISTAMAFQQGNYELWEFFDFNFLESSSASPEN